MRVLIDLTPLRSSRDFRRLWIGQSFSGFGTQMTLVAVMVQVWAATASPAWTGAVGLAQAIPLIVLGPFAGALIDRLDRRRIRLLSTSGQIACSAVLGAQGLTTHLPVPGLLAVAAVQAGFGTAGTPATRAFLPRLLPPGQVAAGLALNRIAFQAALLTGPAAAGVVIGTAGVGACYLIDAGTFALSFAGVLTLPPMRPQGEPSRPGLTGVRDGLAFLAGTPPIRGALLTDLAATVLSFPISLFPLINAERFAGNPRTLGLFLSAIAVGGVLASLLSGTFTHAARPARVMLAAAAGWGLALVLVGACPNPWADLAFLAVAGAADTVSVVTRATVVQRHTPDALRGRVAAAEQIIAQAGPDLGNLRAGLLAAATSGPLSLITGGLTCIAAVALVAAASRRASPVSPR